MNSCCQTRTMERKSQLKTIKSMSIFQLVWFHLVALLFRIGDGSDDKELVNHAQRREDTSDIETASATPQLPWGLVGEGVTACRTPPPEDSPRLSGTSDSAGFKSPDQTDGVTARGSQLNLECTFLACWQIWWTFWSQWRAITDSAPRPMKYWSLFLMDYLLLHLHLLYSVSSSSSHFIL